MNIRRHIFGASFFCGLLMLASVCDANLILNGDFSQTTAGGAVVAQELDVASSTSTYLANWTSTGYNFVFLPGTDAAGGAKQGSGTLNLWSSSNSSGANSWNGQGPTSSLNFIAADPAYNTGPITQTVNGLITGRRYALSFQWAAAQQTGFRGANTEGWTVTLGSQSLSTVTVNNADQGFVPWMMMTMTFTATSTSELLSFLATGGPTGFPPFALLSNVSMNLVPEPASALIWGIGAFGVLIARRRGKKTAR